MHSFYRIELQERPRLVCRFTRQPIDLISWWNDHNGALFVARLVEAIHSGCSSELAVSIVNASVRDPSTSFHFRHSPAIASGSPRSLSTVPLTRQSRRINGVAPDAGEASIVKRCTIAERQCAPDTATSRSVASPPFSRFLLIPSGKHVTFDRRIAQRREVFFERRNVVVELVRHTDVPRPAAEASRRLVN